MQQEDRQERRPRPRIETLSDLIFGLSLSIGAINLVITNSQTSRVSDINKDILEFLFVFLFLITVWMIYTGDMSVLPVETRLVTFLNVVLLMLVAVIPYLFDQVECRFNRATFRTMHLFSSRSTMQPSYSSWLSSRTSSL